MKISESKLKAAEHFFAEHEGEMIAAVCRLVEIESVSQPGSSADAPYGENCNKVLAAMEKICAERGFDFINHENRCGSVRWGEGKEELGVFTHLDVVPAGEGWTGNAFVPVVENGFIRGRGAIDNKGSAIMGLFALECIKALKLPMKHAVRLFYGLNEEDLMTDAEYYIEKIGSPKFSLVPDSMFPAAYAEKGIFAGVLRTGKIAKEIRYLKAGVATNTVAGSCEIRLNAKHFPMLKMFESDRVKVSLEKNKAIVRATGLSAHASMPEQSLNAIALAFDVVLCAGVLSGEEQKTISFWRDCLLDVKGRKLGIDVDMQEYGKLSIIGGLASLEADESFCFGFNCRYPSKDSCARIKEQLQRVCDKLGFEMLVEEAVDGFSLTPDHPVVCALTDIANELTAENRKPFLMKGATYCRVIPNAIPFGPEMDNSAPAFPKGRGGIHQPDESLSIKELLNAARIYVAALIELDAIL